MRTTLLSIMIAGWGLILPAFGQRQELGLMLGAFKPSSRTLDVRPPVPAELSSGAAFYANYGVRLIGGSGAALFFEVPFVASPSHKITSAATLATRDLATLYITPGLRLKFLPKSRVAPFVAAGGGYALFEHSTERIDGRPNQAPRRTSHGALDLGGGVDIKVWRFVSFRAEVRDFLSGSPSFNLPVTGKQHNVLVAAGVGIHF